MGLDSLDLKRVGSSDSTSPLTPNDIVNDEFHQPNHDGSVIEIGVIPLAEENVAQSSRIWTFPWLRDLKGGETLEDLTPSA